VKIGRAFQLKDTSMMTRLGTTLDKVSLTDTSPSLISRIYLGPDDNVFEDAMMALRFSEGAEMTSYTGTAVTIGFLASEGPILCTGERAKTVLLAVRGMTLSTVKVAMIVSATVVATILFLAALEPTGSEVLRGMSWSMAEMAMTQSTATWVWTFYLAGVGTTPSKGQVDAISFMAASGGTLFQAGMGAIGCLAATAMIL